MTGFHGKGKQAEGLESIAEGTWIKMRANNGSSLLAKIIKHGEHFLSAEILDESHSTKKPTKYKSTIPYEPVIFSEIPEAEIKEIIENEPLYERFLGKYIIVNTASGGQRYGRLNELHYQAISLSPFVHKHLGNDRLQLRKQGRSLILNKDITGIESSSKKEIDSLVKDYNRQLREARKESKNHKRRRK